MEFATCHGGRRRDQIVADATFWERACNSACTKANGERTLKENQLYVVQALKNPGPVWKQVTEPIPRSEAVKAVAAQWRFGRLARADKSPPLHQ